MLVVGLGSYGEYVITLGGELLREHPMIIIIIIMEIGNVGMVLVGMGTCTPDT